MRLEAKHWALWATDAKSLEGLGLGYPRREPYWTPTRRQETNSEPPELDEDERAAIIAIRRGINDLRGFDKEQAMLLVEYHGAYIGAPVRPKHRLERVPPKYGDRRRVGYYVDAAKAFVQGRVW